MKIKICGLKHPDNIEAVSALAWGLNEYKGTVIAASHDRDLISHFATKIIAFEKDGIHLFDGPYKEYVLQRERR